MLRLLRDRIAGQHIDIPPLLLRSLEKFPQVTARKSRYSYGIAVCHPIDKLKDYDPILDDIITFSDGIPRAARMRWYLTKGEEVRARSPVYFRYWDEAKTSTSKCTYRILYSSVLPPPKRDDDDTTTELCRISCEWDIPFEEWEEVGDPKDGWRRHNGLALAMSFEGEPKWKMQVGPNKAEHDVRVEYM